MAPIFMQYARMVSENPGAIQEIILAFCVECTIVLLEKGSEDMPRAPDRRIDDAKKMFDEGKKLVEIARTLGICEGTVRSWKNRYQWDCNVAIKEKQRCGKKKEKQRRKKEIPAEVDSAVNSSNLTDRQKLFCVYYIRSFNATKAYQKAYGVDYRTAATNGSRMLRNAQVKEEIIRLKQERLNREFLSEEDIFQKYMDIAFADITDYLEFGTEEVPVMAMYGPVKIKDPDTGEEKGLTKTVNTVRFKSSSEVDGTILAEVKQGRDGASIKLADRMKALQWLSDHMNLATEEQQARIDMMRQKVISEGSTNDEELDQVQFYLPDNGRDG